MTEAQRATLLDAAVKGDADALQRLIVHFHPKLHDIVAAKMPQRFLRYADADDVLQLAYAEAFKSIGDCSFDGVGGLYKWLEKVALTEIRAIVRDLQRRKRDIRRDRHGDSFGPNARCRAGPAARDAGAPTSYPDLLARLPGSGSTPSRHLAKKEATAAVLTSLARLTDDQRTVIRMKFLEDRPTEEIAAALGKSEDAVYMLCTRGLKSLQALLGSISQHLSN